MIKPLLASLISPAIWLTSVAARGPPIQSSIEAEKSPRQCSTDVIGRPHVNGTHIIDFTAEKRTNQSVTSDRGEDMGTRVVSYCGVYVTYGHTGWNDTIHVQISLPLEAWNGRFVGKGGGGWETGYGASALAPEVADGFAAVVTDGGHYSQEAFDPASSWALNSTGGVNFPLLYDFAYLALGEMTQFGQAVTESYYGEPPSFSYWQGCSIGGRQGLMLAQRYPALYDGILALAPAINWDTFVVAEYWPQQVMNNLGVYPAQCELEAFTQAAISACDGLDGVVDGVIANPDACTFDPHGIVGQDFLCNGTVQHFSSAAATVVQAAWTGLFDGQGNRLWYGLSRDASLSGLVETETAANVTTPIPFSVSVDWLELFVAQGTGVHLANMSTTQYLALVQKSQEVYAPIIGTADPDLSPFKAHGGKMITWHGTSDQLIFPNGTIDYYKRVIDTVPHTPDFYRVFEAPGVAHCNGGVGYQPAGEFEALMDWVERGRAPQTLRTINGTVPRDGDLPARDICAWPKKQTYRGGDATLPSSFTCIEPSA